MNLAKKNNKAAIFNLIALLLVIALWPGTQLLAEDNQSSSRNEIPQAVQYTLTINTNDGNGVIALSPAGNVQAIKIASIGNSITVGYQLPSSDSYPSQLQVLLDATYGASTVEVQNFGHSSRTMVKGSSFTYWDSSRFAAAKNFEADISILLLGTNDARVSIWNDFGTNYPSDYIEMISEFKIANPSMQFLLGYPPPVFVYTTWNDNIINGVIPGVDNALNETNTQLIDFNTPMQNSGSLFPDNVHPTAEGYAVMAGIAHDRLVATSLISSLLPGTPTFEENEIVTLTATPDAGYSFDGWSGDLSGTSNPVTITMDADKTVTASFSLQSEMIFSDGFESN